MNREALRIMASDVKWIVLAILAVIAVVALLHLTSATIASVFSVSTDTASAWLMFAMVVSMVLGGFLAIWYIVSAERAGP